MVELCLCRCTACVQRPEPWCGVGALGHKGGPHHRGAREEARGVWAEQAAREHPQPLPRVPELHVEPAVVGHGGVLLQQPDICDDFRHSTAMLVARGMRRFPDSTVAVVWPTDVPVSAGLAHGDCTVVNCSVTVVLSGCADLGQYALLRWRPFWPSSCWITPTSA